MIWLHSELTDKVKVVCFEPWNSEAYTWNKKNFVHWKLFPQSDQPAFCHLLCTKCYQKCAAGDHLEMHECAKHWCFMANRIKLSMIPAFSLNLGFLIDALDIKASVHFCLEKMQNTIATNFYLSRGRKLNINKSNLNQEWGLFRNMFAKIFWWLQMLLVPCPKPHPYPYND